MMYWMSEPWSGKVGAARVVDHREVGKKGGHEERTD